MSYANPDQSSKVRQGVSAADVSAAGLDGAHRIMDSGAVRGLPADEGLDAGPGIGGEANNGYFADAHPAAMAGAGESFPALKRLFDIVCSLLGLVLLLVPMLAIAAVIKLTSKGPAIHWSQRVGRGNELFWLPKFRSMWIETQVTEQQHAAKDSITPVGRFIRNYSLDELPQLWSILKGDMSLVGPRPVLPIEEAFLEMRTLRAIHRIRPGLTGWAQINGRAEVGRVEKVNLDLHYIENQSFWLDLKIIFLTIPRVLTKDGVIDHAKLPD